MTITHEPPLPIRRRDFPYTTSATAQANRTAATAAYNPKRKHTPRLPGSPPRGR